MALFDAYVMVDWSAAATPRRGADSIWIAAYERQAGRLVERQPANPPTRDEAMSGLIDLLSDLSARGLTTLLGFDFNFGFPRGLAGKLDARRGDWLGVWRQLAGRIHDRPDNGNDRFAAAAQLNAELSGGPAPFWGCPPGAACTTLGATKPAAPSSIADALPEFRLTEERAPGCQPVWKLFTAGSVGSQTLLGIPRLLALKDHPWLKDNLRVWPFETGLKALDRPDPGQIVLAEIYPSLIDAPHAGGTSALPLGPVKDARQVSALAGHFAQLDEAGRLSPLFAGDRRLDAAQKALVEHEEGWILGVEGAAAVPAEDILTDPAAIYRRSFAIIRREADLIRFTGAMDAVAMRVIHACGMPEIAPDLAFSPGAAEAGRAALAAGKPVLADARMVAHGIIASRLPAANQVICTLDDLETARLAERLATTRSAASVHLWTERLDGAVVAIGNAPTALFELLDLIAAGAPAPAVILGFPVGFVGAAESKEALIASGLPHIALRGRRGGSAMAAAAVNALAGEQT